MDTSESLLRAILATVGRNAFSPKTILSIVAPRDGSEKSLAAYNMCDGNTSQAEIVKRLKLDKSNFSKTLARWIEAGVVVRVGRDERPLHVYPISKEMVKEKKE
jgi:DNA-binding MarR family transcriptional regulator